MPKFNIVLRRNPSGAASKASKGRKIRTMGPYTSRASAVADAKALKTKQGVAVLVEPATADRKRRAKASRYRASPAARVPASPKKVRRIIRRGMASAGAKRRRTGPSRGRAVGAVSNPAPAATRKFGTKRYKRARKTWYKTKTEAKKRQAKLSKTCFTRLTGTTGRYMVWCKKKPASALRTNPKGKKPTTKARRAKGQHRRSRAGGPSRPLRAGYALTNPRGGSGDAIAARELVLFGDNDYGLYRRMKLPIEENLQRKIKRGTYSKTKAVKAWMNFADEAAREYNVQFGDGRRSMRIFDKPTRLLAAKEFADMFHEEYASARRNPRKKAARRRVSRRVGPTTRRAIGRHSGPSTHVHSHRRHHAGAGVRGNPHKMTKKQFEDYFREHIMPAVRQQEADWGGGVDGPLRRETWNNVVDGYIQDGMLSERAYDWSHPSWLERRRRRSW